MAGRWWRGPGARWRKGLAHEDAERMLRVRTERAPPRIALPRVEGQGLGLVRTRFQKQLLAPHPGRCRLKFSQDLLRHALAAMCRAHIHALQLAVLRRNQHRAAATGLAA